MTKIKICGLKRPQDIAYVNELLPEYIGFVFAESSRQVSFAEAEQLRAKLDERVMAVGVFVSEEPTKIAAAAKAGIIDCIQLHGEQSQEDCLRLKNLTDKPVIKVLRLSNAAQQAEIDCLSGLADYCCDYYLFDTYAPNVYGGVGTSFDWQKLKDQNIPKPYFVAGGLNKDNVQAAIKLLQPYAVDVSGGVETNGYKDLQKMREFIRTVRNINLQRSCNNE